MGDTALVIHVPNPSRQVASIFSEHILHSTYRVASRTGPAPTLSAYPTSLNPLRRLHSYRARHLLGSVFRSLRHFLFSHLCQFCGVGPLPPGALLRSNRRLLPGWGAPSFLDLPGPPYGVSLLVPIAQRFNTSDVSKRSAPKIKIELCDLTFNWPGATTRNLFLSGIRQSTTISPRRPLALERRLSLPDRREDDMYDYIIRLFCHAPSSPSSLRSVAEPATRAVSAHHRARETFHSAHNSAGPLFGWSASA